MDGTPLQTNALAPVFEQASMLLDSATQQEIVTAFALPLLAVFLGLRLGRLFNRLSKTNWQTRFAAFITPLLVPGFALLFTSIALAVFKGVGTTPLILPFVIKVMVAWLAMRTVILLNEREIAGWFIALVIIPVTLLHLLDLWEPLVTVMETVEFSLGKKIHLNLYLVLKTLAALIALFWLGGFVTKTTDRRLKKMRGLHASNRALILKLFQIIIYFVIFIAVLQTMGIDITALSFFGGAFGVALGFGLQKIASNFVCGIIMLFEKSVDIGDVIELADGTMGIVRRTSARYTLIEMNDSKEILIPNEEFINQRVLNWTHSHSRGRAEIIIQIAFDADVEKARLLMLEAATKHPKCLATPKPMCLISKFPEGNVELTLYFWVADMVDGRLEPRGEVSLAIWKAFRANKIEAAPPQRVIWKNE